MKSLHIGLMSLFLMCLGFEVFGGVEPSEENGCSCKAQCILWGSRCYSDDQCKADCYNKCNGVGVCRF